MRFLGVVGLVSRASLIRGFGFTDYLFTMKKSLLIAAGLAAAGAANAQLSVIGVIDLSYGKSNASDAAGHRAASHSVGDDGSIQGNPTTRVGVKSSMDVGSGVKANLKLETGGITSDGEVNPGGAFFDRQAWSLGFVR